MAELYDMATEDVRDPDSARAQAIKTAVRNYKAAHKKPPEHLQRLADELNGRPEKKPEPEPEPLPEPEPESEPKPQDFSVSVDGVDQGPGQVDTRPDDSHPGEQITPESGHRPRSKPKPDEPIFHELPGPLSSRRPRRKPKEETK